MKSKLAKYHIKSSVKTKGKVVKVSVFTFEQSHAMFIAFVQILLVTAIYTSKEIRYHFASKTQPKSTSPRRIDTVLVCM
jgi:hypothetical protein